MLSAAESRAAWRSIYARTFMRLQREYPLQSRTYMAHMARDAADAAADELILELTAPTPRRSADDE